MSVTQLIHRAGFDLASPGCEGAVLVLARVAPFFHCTPNIHAYTQVQWKAAQAVMRDNRKGVQLTLAASCCCYRTASVSQIHGVLLFCDGCAVLQQPSLQSVV